MRQDLTEEQIYQMSLYYKAVFGSPQGKTVLRDILEICYFFNDDIPAEAADIIGKQNVGRVIAWMCGGYNNPEDLKNYIVDGIVDVPLLPIKQED